MNMALRDINYSVPAFSYKVYNLSEHFKTDIMNMLVTQYVIDYVL